MSPPGSFYNRLSHSLPYRSFVSSFTWVFYSGKEKYKIILAFSVKYLTFVTCLRCHSSVGRAKDWKSLCPWFDSRWYHKAKRVIVAVILFSFPILSIPELASLSSSPIRQTPLFTHWGRALTCNFHRILLSKTQQKEEVEEWFLFFTKKVRPPGGNWERNK